MSEKIVIQWLDDRTLSSIANQGACDRSLFEQRYDATCPSEFYRGYATLLTQIGDAFGSNSNLAILHELVDAFDPAIMALPADELRNGASFALVNVAAYAQAGTAAQVSATLAAEIVCIAHCFVQNQAAGL